MSAVSYSARIKWFPLIAAAGLQGGGHCETHCDPPFWSQQQHWVWCIVLLSQSVQPACLLRADNHRNKYSTTKGLIQGTPPSPPITALRPTGDRYHGRSLWSVRIFQIVCVCLTSFGDYAPRCPKTEWISICVGVQWFVKNPLIRNIRIVPLGT